VISRTQPKSIKLEWAPALDKKPIDDGLFCLHMLAWSGFAIVGKLI
jgi:hypothetical protein